MGLKDAVKKVGKKSETNKIIFKSLETLLTIKEDKTLFDVIFESDIDIDLLIVSAKQGTLPTNIHSRLEEMFERVISKNTNPFRRYKRIYLENLQSELGEPIKLKLPKHYGKKRILADIKNNKKKTELDDAMLALNTMRNLYATLKRRAIKDKLTGENSLTELDCREIIATVRTLENKITKITKK